MPLGSCTRRGSCGLNWCSAGMGTFCQEVATPLDGLAVDDSALGVDGWAVWAWAAANERASTSESNAFTWFISALLWPVRRAALVAFQDRKSKSLNSNHGHISYAGVCFK